MVIFIHSSKTGHRKDWIFFRQPPMKDVTREKMTNSDFNTGNWKCINCVCSPHWFVFLLSRWLSGPISPQRQVTPSGPHLRGDDWGDDCQSKTGLSPSGGNGVVCVQKLHSEEILSWKPLWKPQRGPLPQEGDSEMKYHSLTSIMNKTNWSSQLPETHWTPIST